MSQELFSGQWIQGENYDYGNEDELYYHNHPNTILYKSFDLDRIDKENIFRIAVLGYYVLSVNGKRVSIAELNNDWTDFTKCVYFDEYDITNYLNIGMNEIEIELGNGTYNPSPLRLFGKYNLRQRLAEIGEPKAICELIVNQKTYLSSDSSWLYKPGYYLFNNLYLGEKIDYTLQREGQNIKFKLNGTGMVNDYEMKYYKSDNFLLLRIKIYNNYTCEKFVKFNGKWYSIFYATRNMNGRSDLIQEYNELINRYNNDKGKTQNITISSVACPYCHSRNTSKIGTVSRMFSAGLFGLGSKKIGKQWHCNSCGSDF